MSDSTTYNKGKRTFIALTIGMLVGAAVLCIYIAPSVIQKGMKNATAAIQQENLISARGEAYDSFAMADVSLTVLLDGKPHENMSVAADRGFWTVPQDGEVNLSLAPGSYRFTAGFENRKITFSGEVFVGQPNAFVLDVNKAPSAPELQIWDIPAGESISIALEITGANEVSSENVPDGVTIAKRDGEFVLLVDGSRLSRGFYCMKLTADNEYGQAFSYVCLRLPRNESVTPIYTTEDLDAVRSDLSGYYMLMNDLDMSGVDGWIPIGTVANPFTGLFDGGGYEISGFHAPALITEGDSFALFGYVQNAEIRNVIFREPDITPSVPARDIGSYFKSGILAVTPIDSMIENCGSFGGIVNPSDGAVGGLFTGVNYSIVLNCFNSADVFCNMANGYLPNTGGIMGGMYMSYAAGCANEGEIKGNHLSGGIAGHAGNSDITRCINSGFIWGSTIVGAVPAGGIAQAIDGGTAYNAYFVRGQSPIGSHSGSGFIAAIIPIDESELLAHDKLPLIGSLDGDNPDWAYASFDAKGPVPYGIFREQTPAPFLNEAGNHIDIPLVDGLLYFYTLDGSDPHMNCAEPVPELGLSLKKGQTLKIFAAKQGCRDSIIITVVGG